MGNDRSKENQKFIVPPPSDPPRVDVPPPPPPPKPSLVDSLKAVLIKHKWFTILLGIMLIGAVLIVLLIKNGDQPENVVTAPISTTIPEYSKNGFYIDRVNARLLDRSYIGSFQGENDQEQRKNYYETVFNMAVDDKSFDLFAEPIDLGEVPIGAMKRSELVLCLHYKQDSASTDVVNGELILNGLESDAVQKEFSLNGLYETGQIYVGLDELVPDVSLWKIGTYQLKLMMDGLVACTYEIELAA